ncbi:MAG: tetratricopeptide repeat protein [Salinivenus sp.]
MSAARDLVWCTEAARRWGWMLASMACLVLVLSGCGRSSFVGRQYDDFTAYYNKFYNAERAFEDEVESLRDVGGEVDRTRYLSLFVEPSDASEEAFETVIEKSADVLREHPNSKWVDEALLLIGRSYYYQENYVGAAQKFREVISLGTGREGEARYWLARALIADERFEAADEALAEGLGSEAEGDTWTAQMRMARGELLVRQEQWEPAEEALRRGVEGDLPDRLGARGAFLLGQVRHRHEDVEGAREAYQRVLDYSPRYELAFAARLSDVELQGRHGDMEAALDRLEDLEQDDKNYELRGQMALVRARILRANNRPDEAQEVLQAALYGEEASREDFQGRLHYELGTLYRDAFEDFDTAAAHFDTARTDMREPESKTSLDRRLPSAPANVEANASQLQDLSEEAREVTRLDSLLRLGKMSEDELQEFVAELQERRREQREEARSARDESSGRGREARRLRQGSARDIQEQQESAAAEDTRDSDAGFLFYNDPARVQQGQQRFRQIWGDRGRVDNWRRREAVRRARTAEADKEEAETEEGGVPGAEQGAGATIDLSAVPRDSARRAEMKAERAVARYEFANALFLVAQQPDSAATWYRRIIEEDSAHSVADRAQYALAEVHRAQGDTEAAQAAYRRVIEADPESRLAAQARKRLGQPEDDKEERAVADADSVYARAYDRWRRGRPDSALVDMLDLARRYPNTPAAPRALFASSVIYWRQMQRGATPPSGAVLARQLPALDTVGTDGPPSDGSPGATGMGRGGPVLPSIPADTTAPDSADTSPEPTGADTSEASALLTSDDVPQDTTDTAARRDTTPSARPDSLGPSRREPDSARAAQGPWTLVIASLRQDSTAQETARRYRDRLSTSDGSVRVCAGDDRFRVGVGRFESEKEAQERKEEFGNRLPENAWTYECSDAQEGAPTRADASAAADSSRATGRKSSETEGYAALEALLTFLTREYPEAPQTNRAQSLLELVQARRTRADSGASTQLPDPEAQAGPEASPADSSARSPSPHPRE